VESKEIVEREVNVLKEALKLKKEPITLDFCGIEMTPAGTLLATWQAAPGTNAEALRAEMKSLFSEAPAGQTERILHTTLLRVLHIPTQKQQDKGTNCFDSEAKQLKNTDVRPSGCSSDSPTDSRAKLMNDLEKIAEKHGLMASSAQRLRSHESASDSNATRLSAKTLVFTGCKDYFEANRFWTRIPLGCADDAVVAVH